MSTKPRREPTFTVREILLLILLAVLVMVPYTHAWTAEPALSPGQCRSLGAIAAATVRTRLQGMPMTEVLEMAGKNFDQSADGAPREHRAEIEAHYDHVVQVIAWVYKLPKVQANANEEAVKAPDGEIVGYIQRFEGGDVPDPVEGSPAWVSRFFETSCAATRGRPPMIGKRM